VVSSIGSTGRDEVSALVQLLERSEDEVLTALGLVQRVRTAEHAVQFIALRPPVGEGTGVSSIEQMDHEPAPARISYNLAV
jgi:hypothetical protein